MPASFSEAERCVNAPPNCGTLPASSEFQTLFQLDKFTIGQAVKKTPQSRMCFEPPASPWV